LPAEDAMTIKANESTTTVALLGTGTMGAAMARRLRGRGLTVRAWNRTPARAEPLRADGVEVLETPRAAATGADVVVTMLADGPAVQAAIEGPTGALAGAAAGSCWLQTSTVGVLACGRLVELATRAQLPFIDAPVLGTKQPAERGELTVLAAGPRALESRVQPVFEAIARKVFWLDEAPGAATRAGAGGRARPAADDGCGAELRPRRGPGPRRRGHGRGGDPAATWVVAPRAAGSTELTWQSGSRTGPLELAWQSGPALRATQRDAPRV
jgi:hypothetical protein